MPHFAIPDSAFSAVEAELAAVLDDSRLRAAIAGQAIVVLDHRGNVSFIAMRVDRAFDGWWQ